MSEIDSGYDFDSTQPLPDISGQTEPLPDVRGIPLSSQRNRTNTSVSRRTFLQRAAGVVQVG